jgi:hypothetical protein
MSRDRRFSPCAQTRVFSGTPALGDAGKFTIKLTATDAASASVTDLWVANY